MSRPGKQIKRQTNFHFLLLLLILGLATAVALVYQAELWVLLLHHLSNHYNKKSYSHTKAFNLKHIRAAVVVSSTLYLVRVLCRSRFQFRTYF